MKKDQWITDFVGELVVRLRPELGTKYAKTIAVHEWLRSSEMPPEEAARRWVTEREMSRRKK